MPAATLPIPVQAPGSAVEGPVRKRFTRDEVYRMMDAGVFEGQRFELIDGELIVKMGQKPPHGYTIQAVHDWLITFLPGVRVQLSMEAAGDDRDTSEPEPDIAVLREKKAEYHQRHPRGDEMLLVVEASDTTRSFDLGRKAVLYARSGVPEYWVVDLPRRMFVVHRQPDGEQYRLIQVLSEEDAISLQGRAESVKAKDLLPPRD